MRVLRDWLERRRRRRALKAAARLLVDTVAMFMAWMVLIKCYPEALREWRWQRRVEAGFHWVLRDWDLSFVEDGFSWLFGDG